MSNISEEVDGMVSTYFEAAEDHDLFSVHIREDESWEKVLAAEKDSDEFSYLDMHLSGEVDLNAKPPDLLPQTRFYKSSSLPPGCRIVHEFFNGNLEVWYKSADGTRYNSKAQLIAAKSSSLPLDQKQADPIKFVVTSNNINNNQSHNNLVSQASEDPKSSEILSLSSSSVRANPVSTDGEASTSETGGKNVA